MEKNDILGENVYAREFLLCIWGFLVFFVKCEVLKFLCSPTVVNECSIN